MEEMITISVINIANPTSRKRNNWKNILRLDFFCLKANK
jgi:hypothetical protein